jgi:hypothetical protein
MYIDRVQLEKIDVSAGDSQYIYKSLIEYTFEPNAKFIVDHVSDMKDLLSNLSKNSGSQKMWQKEALHLHVCRDRLGYDSCPRPAVRNKLPKNRCPRPAVRNNRPWTSCPTPEVGIMLPEKAVFDQLSETNCYAQAALRQLSETSYQEASCPRLAVRRSCHR